MKGEGDRPTREDELKLQVESIDLAVRRAKTIHGNAILDSRFAAHVNISARDGVLSPDAHEAFVDDFLARDKPSRGWITYISLKADGDMAKAYARRDESSFQSLRLEQATRTAQALNGRKDQQPLLPDRQILLNAVADQVCVAAGHLPGKPPTQG